MKKAILLLILISLLLAVTACGSPDAEPATPAETGPQQPDTLTAQSVRVTTDNQGMDAQHVNIILEFDGDAAPLSAADFSAVVAEEPVAAENLAVSAQGSILTVTLTVAAIKNGYIELTYNGGGAAPFRVEAVVSPGVELETVAQDADTASVTVRVSDLPRVRGIARVMLLENGEPLETQSETPAPFAAVHCHDFLNLDGPALAENIAAALNENFPEGYSATAERDTVTVCKTGAASVELELAIQHWETLETE
ncbi:MAG: hypothetical protein K6B40_07540 [Firmicutes bacterium]|nr:hypothetical protein [Bacillota bacterium]